MVLLTNKKASEFLSVHPETLRRWARSGEIKTIRTAGKKRLYDVEEYIKRKEMEGKEERESKVS